MTAIQTTLDLRSSGASGAPAVPFYLNVDAEILRVSAVDVDTPSAGKDRLTVARAQAGTSASTHTAGATVEQNAYAIQVEELQDRVAWLELGMAAMRGGLAKSGVIPMLPNTGLKVVAQGTPDMTVEISTGAGLVAGQTVGVGAAVDTAAMTAPAANPRIDLVQIDQSGSVEVKTGTEAGSPVAPTVDADALALATIYHRVGSTSIKNSDDSSNSYIIDARSYA
jgi:hypothetical protein